MSIIDNYYTENIKDLTNKLCDDALDHDQRAAIVENLEKYLHQYSEHLYNDVHGYYLAIYCAEYDDYGFFHYYDILGYMPRTKALDYINHLDDYCYDAVIRKITFETYQKFHDLQALEHIRKYLISLRQYDKKLAAAKRIIDDKIKILREQLELKDPWDTIKLD